MFATLVYNHCNICNIPIYFCNIHTEHLQHTSDTSKTLETYSCNISFQRNICLLLGRLKAHRRGAQCRRVTRSSGGDGGGHGGECRGGRMAQWRGRMAGGNAGARWRERTTVGQARWRALWRHGHDGGAVNGEERTTGSQADIVGARGYASGELGRWNEVVTHERENPNKRMSLSQR
jgi:hypothetical protein